MGSESEIVMGARLPDLFGVGFDNLKIVSNDLRPEAEVNELVLLVGPEFFCLRWGAADQVREQLCALFDETGLQVPSTANAGIAKVH